MSCLSVCLSKYAIFSTYSSWSESWLDPVSFFNFENWKMWMYRIFWHFTAISEVWTIRVISGLCAMQMLSTWLWTQLLNLLVIFWCICCFVSYMTANVLTGLLGSSGTVQFHSNQWTSCWCTSVYGEYSWLMIEWWSPRGHVFGFEDPRGHF